MAPFSGDGKFYEGTIEKICRESNPYRAQVRYIGYCLLKSFDQFAFAQIIILPNCESE